MVLRCRYYGSLVIIAALELALQEAHLASIDKTLAAVTTALVIAGQIASAHESHSLVADQPHDHREANAQPYTQTTVAPMDVPGGCERVQRP